MTGEVAGAAGRPIVLAGFMGAGKTSVGRGLAAALGRAFFDTDVLVAERLGAGIAELFAAGREGDFRSHEREVVAELIASCPDAVIALGGGALEDATTRHLLATRAVVVYLRHPWEEIAAALPSLRRGRPLIAAASEDDVRVLFAAREPVYEACGLAVDVGRDGVAEAVAAVLSALGERPGATREVTEGASETGGGPLP